MFTKSASIVETQTHVQVSVTYDARSVSPGVESELIVSVSLAVGETPEGARALPVGGVRCELQEKNTKLSDVWALRDYAFALIDATKLAENLQAIKAKSAVEIIRKVTDLLSDLPNSRCKVKRLRLAA